jgi:20S proteasome alpha/beta subunit
LAGYDISTSLSHLYWIDYLGTKAVVPYAAHGLGVYVALSTMDKWWYPDIQRREGVDVLKKCVNEVEKRECRGRRRCPSCLARSCFLDSASVTTISFGSASASAPLAFFVRFPFLLCTADWCGV